MTSFKSVMCFVAAIVLAVPAVSFAGGPPLFSPADTWYGVDADIVPDSNFPAAEAGATIIDGASGSKYLNFGKENSGFVLTPTAASTVQSFQILSANDAPERDPISWELYGFNGAVTETPNGQGLADAWVSIATGADTGFSTDPGRFAFGTLQSFTNTTAYDSYKMVFPTVRDASIANSMQIDELQFFSDAGGAAPITLAGGSVIEIDADAPSSQSSYPAPGEDPAKALDGDLSTKYLNFAGGNSGFIVTSSSGPVVADTLNLITANSPGQGEQDRNPLDYEVYGTNDAIMSVDNSTGLAENWTLLGSGATGLDAMSPPSTPSGDLGFGNTTAYSSYKVIFPTIANSGIMQIGEATLSAVPEPSSFVLVGVAFAGLLGLRRRRR